VIAGLYAAFGVYGAVYSVVAAVHSVGHDYLRFRYTTAGHILFAALYIMVVLTMTCGSIGAWRGITRRALLFASLGLIVFVSSERISTSTPDLSVSSIIGIIITIGLVTLFCGLPIPLLLTSGSAAFCKSFRSGRAHVITIAVIVMAMVMIFVCTVIVTFTGPKWYRLAAGFSSQVELPFFGLKNPSAVAVDANGSVYIADGGNNRVLELPAGSTNQVQLPIYGLDFPSDGRVDATGDLYVTDAHHGRVLVFAAGAEAASPVRLSNSLNFPSGVAIDYDRNLYISDSRGNQVLYLPRSGNEATTLPFTDLSSPGDVVLDNSGNVLITNSKKHQVLKLQARSNKQTTLLEGLDEPDDLAVDSAGGIYITETGSNRVLKLAAGSTSPTILPFAGLNHPTGVAVDTAGNVYITDKYNNRVLKLAAR
jgi:sugar lactone lactonase YvrE